MRSTAAIVASSLLLAGSIAVAVPAQAAQADAVGAWSMVPQSKDANDDGIIDGDGGVPRRGALSRLPSGDLVGAGNRIAQPHERLISGTLSWYLSDRGFPVRLDACGSTGKDHRWTIESADRATITTAWRGLGPKVCRQVVRLPEGDYTLNLEVRSGRTSDTWSRDAQVLNHLVLALGDSYASGEGNPRNVRSWVRQGGTFDPYWDDEACHRSARSGPAQAALTLEKESSASSVTFVDVSCSGATISAGVLGAQPSAGTRSSQIEEAAAILRGHAVDLVTISVGGNDVGFTSVLQACALNDDCPLSRASSPPLSRYPSVHDGVQAETGSLAVGYARIAACLGGASCELVGGRTTTPIEMSPGARVLPTLYPDITRAASGAVCSYFTISREEFGWARNSILNPVPVNPYRYARSDGRVAELSVANGSLNQQVTNTRSRLGWLPVTGTWTATGTSAVGHGVCAGDQAWVFGATLLTSFPSASFHPNIPGQRVLAAAIARAMLIAINP